MAKDNVTQGEVGNKAPTTDRMAKAKISRAVTSAQLAALPDNVRAAYGIVNQAIKAAEGIKAKILRGGQPTGQELEACGNLIARSAASMV